jgi:hypothetical protein
MATTAKCPKRTRGMFDIDANESYIKQEAKEKEMNRELESSK